jgi:methylaspartate mutase sigma subunit
MSKVTKPTAIVATTPDDSHMWNLVGVQLKLEERGFIVKNLGSCTPPTEIAELVRDLKPDLLVISTINGHGVFSISAILETLQEYQMIRTAKIIVGGLLTTDPELAAKAEAELIAQGVGSVLTGENAWDRFDDMWNALQQQG